MKNVKSLKTYLFLCLALASSAIMTSCGDDESAPDIISVKDVIGNYSGKMLMAEITPQSANKEANTPGTVDVTAAVNDKEVVFEKFPVAGIITAIVGEEDAAAIIAAVGDVAYKLPYTAELNKEYTEIGMAFTPQPLEVKVTLPSEVEGEEPKEVTIVVTLSTTEKGLFTYEGESLKFGMKIDKIMVGEDEIPFTTTLNFHLNKTK